jgi:hypothetical protein
VLSVVVMLVLMVVVILIVEDEYQLSELEAPKAFFTNSVAIPLALLLMITKKTC